MCLSSEQARTIYLYGLIYIVIINCITAPISIDTIGICCIMNNIMFISEAKKYLFALYIYWYRKSPVGCIWYNWSENGGGKPTSSNKTINRLVQRNFKILFMWNHKTIIFAL